jgi:hypothetical protein
VQLLLNLNCVVVGAPHFIHGVTERLTLQIDGAQSDIGAALTGFLCQDPVGRWRERTEWRCASVDGGGDASPTSPSTTSHSVCLLEDARDRGRREQRRESRARRKKQRGEAIWTR